MFLSWVLYHSRTSPLMIDCSPHLYGHGMGARSHSWLMCVWNSNSYLLYHPVAILVEASSLGFYLRQPLGYWKANKSSWHMQEWVCTKLLPHYKSSHSVQAVLSAHDIILSSVISLAVNTALHSTVRWVPYIVNTLPTSEHSGISTNLRCLKKLQKKAA